MLNVLGISILITIFLLFIGVYKFINEVIILLQEIKKILKERKGYLE
jgi:hypothetical protein